MPSDDTLTFEVTYRVEQVPPPGEPPQSRLVLQMKGHRWSVEFDDPLGAERASRVLEED